MNLHTLKNHESMSTQIEYSTAVQHLRMALFLSKPARPHLSARHGTEVFLGRLDAARAQATAARTALDPDGWLARFVRSQMIEKPGAVQAGRRSAVVGVGFTRRHRGKPLCQDIVSPVDTGRLMGGPFGSVGVDTRADYCDVARRRTVDRLGIKIEPVQVRFR